MTRGTVFAVAAGFVIGLAFAFGSGGSDPSVGGTRFCNHPVNSENGNFLRFPRYT
jgi:hypothetical protein